jgi:4-amino-4-deoxy-L-arabinose transferase-like glycosyltransferase
MAVNTQVSQVGEHNKWRVTAAQATWIEFLVVLLLFLAALGVRTYRLHDLPPGLFADEAAYGLDALSVLDGERPIFFPRNTGREPLFQYLEAGVISLLGPTPYALRLTAAVIGALAVPAAYWMVRELFWNSPLSKSLALWSALFMAFGYWHISLSRIAFRANLVPLLAAITFALFWRAWRRLLADEKFPWLPLVLTGIALGITLYTYTSSRLMPFLVVVMAVATALRPGIDRRQRQRALGGLAVIAITSAIVFAPLGWYFVQHPDQFAGRAASVSFVSGEYSEGNPTQTFVTTAGRTLLMFLTVGDPNLRHNPGDRPVFDLLLGLWLYAGLALCLVHWRKLQYLFLVSWFALLLLPNLLSAEAPHSLRAIGLIPAVYVLPVLAMLSAGAWLAARLPARRAAWGRWQAWLPLPFFVISAVTSVQSYFGAWSDMDRFNSYFMIDYVQLANDIINTQEPRSIWLMPLSPNYFLTDYTFFTMEYLTKDKVDYTSVLVRPDDATEQMTAALTGKRQAYLVLTQDSERFPEASYMLGDPKHLVKYLLDKFGVLEEERDDSLLGMPYLVYNVPEDATYAVFGDETPTDASFEGRLALTATSFGRTAQAQKDVDVNSRQVHAGEPIWVALRWRADTPIDIDLKTSLRVRDAAGHVVGRVDDLLVGDRYPVERVWEKGEETASYHIVPLLSGLPPGTYDITLRVYEDLSQRPYPLLDEEGSPAGIDTVIGSIEILPATGPQEVTPQQVFDPAEILAPNLRLLGYDLPATSVAPGGTLPLTLYWTADAALDADYTAKLELRAPDGAAVLERAQEVGGDYGTSNWSPTATLRDWQDVAIPLETPNGAYRLWLTLTDGEQVLGEQDLGEITVEGRPHEFGIPAIEAPIAASFGGAVEMLGLERSLPASAAPGASLDVPLVWQVSQPSERPLVRFVHLLGADGRPVAQQDGIACAGECPTSTWVADEVLRDTITLSIPPEAPGGEYTLAVGWYDSETLQRLDARDADGAALPDQLLRLGQVTLVR